MISVAIPAFKAKYLQKSISCILNQTYDNFELIIVNDGSPENITKIVNSFSDSRLRYYENKKNTGPENVVKNWNRCLSLARGEYFILFSDDDVCEMNYLEEMIKLTAKYPQVDLYHCRISTINEKGKILSVASTCPEFEAGIDFIWNRFMGGRLHAAPDFMVKTKALMEIGGFVDLPYAWGTDDLTWFTLALRNGVAYSNNILVCWRLSQINISKVGNVEKRFSALRQYDDFVRSSIFHTTEYKSHIHKDVIEKNYNKWYNDLKINLINYAVLDAHSIIYIILNYKDINISLYKLLRIFLRKLFGGS